MHVKHMIRLGCAAILSACLGVPAYAEVQLGAKVWQADISSDDGDGDALMYGPTFYADLSDTLWLSAAYLLGEEDYVGNNSTDTWDAEGIIGMSLGEIDVGLGYRFWHNEYATSNESLDEYGPMAYVGMGDRFGESPFGWYGSGTWAFTDMGDSGDMAHYIVEGGLTMSLDTLTLAVGYRYKNYYDSPASYVYGGPSANLSISF